MKGKKGKDIYLRANALIDASMGCIEICSVPEARADLVANQIDLSYWTRYPLSNKITLNKGIKHLVEFKTMMANDYGYRVAQTIQEAHKPIQ